MGRSHVSSLAVGALLAAHGELREVAPSEFLNRGPGETGDEGDEKRESGDNCR